MDFINGNMRIGRIFMAGKISVNALLVNRFVLFIIIKLKTALESTLVCHLDINLLIVTHDVRLIETVWLFLSYFLAFFFSFNLFFFFFFFFFNLSPSRMSDLIYYLFLFTTDGELWVIEMSVNLEVEKS